MLNDDRSYKMLTEKAVKAKDPKAVIHLCPKDAMPKRVKKRKRAANSDESDAGGRTAASADSSSEDDKQKKKGKGKGKKKDKKPEHKIEDKRTEYMRLLQQKYTTGGASSLLCTGIITR